jgi:hypothetical protein
MKHTTGKKIVYMLSGLLVVLVFTGWLLARKPVPEQIVYGMSFNTPYARELGLDWRVTYDAVLDDLQVRHLRLAAHWPMIEPAPNVYNFEELDYQVRRAEEVGATVILAVGRRLPRWPECHVPDWTGTLSTEERQAALSRYLEQVVRRYQHSPAVVMWQVENEPFLEVFAYDHCGELDVDFLDKEIALVRKIDATRPVLLTDSGNLGTWVGAYRRGDAFGTSVYVHFWNPVKDVPLDVQFTRMNLEKFEDILHYAAETRYEKQYLWGAEWWYWLYLQGHPEMWERGQRLFVKGTE